MLNPKQPLSKLLEEVMDATGCREIDLERVLELRPFGYLKDSIKNCEVFCYEEPDGLRALLMILKVYPWMLLIAEKNYDEKFTAKTLAHMGIELIFQDKDSTAC